MQPMYLTNQRIERGFPNLRACGFGFRPKLTQLGEFGARQAVGDSDCD